MPEGEYFDGRRFTGLSTLLGLLPVASLALCLVRRVPESPSIQLFLAVCVRVLLYALRGLLLLDDRSPRHRRRLVCGCAASIGKHRCVIRGAGTSFHSNPAAAPPPLLVDGHSAGTRGGAGFQTRVSQFSLVLNSRDYLFCFLDRCVTIAAAIFRAPGQRRKSAVHDLDAPGVVHQFAAVCPLSHVWRLRLDDEPQLSLVHPPCLACTSLREQLAARWHCWCW